MFGLIRTDDLHRWAGRYDAPAEFPRLVRLLVHAQVRSPKLINFPADEAVRSAGYDGQLEIATAVSGLPEGVSVWEMGTNGDIKGKADDDYSKRTTDPKGVDQKNTTFVFVTPRRWPGKADWAEARSKEGIWKQVLAFDAESMVQWLEVAPAVALWFGRKTGLVPPGARALEAMVADYRVATNPEFDPAGTLIGRQAEQAALVKVLLSGPQFVEIEAMTEQEGIAFIGATIATLSPDQQDAMWSRAIWLQDLDSVRAVAPACEGHLLVVSEEVSLLPLERRGHTVIRITETERGGRECVVLGNQPMSALVTFVERQGVDRNEAYQRCHDAAGILERVRRGLMVAAPPPPKWSQPPLSTGVAAAALIGLWDEANENDRDAISEIAGTEYDRFVSSIAAWAKGADPLVTRAGTEWRIHDRRGAWRLLEPFLTTKQLESWFSVVERVLLEADPRFELPADERWLASIHGKRRAHSESVRQGLVEGLRLMACEGDERQPCYAGRSPQDWANQAARNVFRHHKEPLFWRRIRGQLTELSEASPDQFLEVLEAEMSEPAPQVLELFEEEGDHGGCLHSDLLWALEGLGWAKTYVGRVSRVLAKLAAKDPGGRYSNRPANSLVGMLHPAFPQCAAATPERHAILKVLADIDPEVTAGLCESLIDGRGGIVHSIHRPVLRRWTPIDRTGAVRTSEYWKDVQAIARQLLRMAETSPRRWQSLLQNLNQFSPEVREEVLAGLEGACEKLGQDNKALLRMRLRKLLHHHNQFRHGEREVDWVYDDATMARLEAAYEALMPEDTVLRDSWLFDFHPERPTSVAVNWQEERANVEADQLVAAESLAEMGVDLLLGRLSEFANRRALGFAMARCKRADAIADVLIGKHADSDIDAVKELIQGFSASQYDQKGKAFLERWVLGPREGALSERGCAAVLVGLPGSMETWDAAEGRGKECAAQYWRNAFVHLVDRPADAERAAKALLAVGRPLQAIDVLAMNVKTDWLSSSGNVGLVVEALSAGVEASNGDPAEGQRVSHAITTLLRRLNKCGKVDATELTRLEWAYFALLKHEGQHELNIYRRLTSEPELLVELLALLYRPEGEPKDSRSDPTEEERRMARQAADVLSDWRPFGNMKPKEMPSEENLIAYTEKLLEIARGRGFEAVAKDHLGKALSSSPVGVDGIWPHETIRQILDRYPLPEVQEGFIVGRYNARGTTSRGLGDGGQQERDLAQTYREWQKALAISSPTTSKLLGKMAEGYESEARVMDVDHLRKH